MSPLTCQQIGANKCLENQNKNFCTVLLILECNIFRKYCTYNKVVCVKHDQGVLTIVKQNRSDDCFNHNLNYIRQFLAMQETTEHLFKMIQMTRYDI